MASSVLSFDHFGFRYGKDEPKDNPWVLQDVSVTAEEGEVLLVVGRSGCGKSTLALALNGTVPHLIEGETTGSVTVAGLPVLDSKVQDLALHVGMVFQDPELQLFALTVEDEVAMSLESYGMPRGEMRERVKWAMSVCGLEGMELKPPGKLSGGQMQRVAIAAVLAREPELLVFDEPTGNLDPAGSRQVYETIRRICDERGRTIVLVEQDLAPVIDLVDNIVLLEEGKVLYQGKPYEVMRELDFLRQCGIKIPAATEFGLDLERKGLYSYSRIPLTAAEAAGPVKHLFKPAGLAAPKEAAASADPPADRAPTGPAAPEKPAPVVEFRQVSHRYDTGQLALDSINLSIYPGEFVAIIGMNGAGKTTAALHVAGLLKPTSGKVLVEGVDTLDKTVAEMARTVGLIFQNPNDQLFKDSIIAEVAFGPRNLGWDEERTKAATAHALDLVGLEGLGDRDPDSLSIGERQRVAVASVLVMVPKVLLLDEPTTGQDQRTLEPFMRLVTELNHRGMTVLMITHDMEVAMKYGSRVVVMSGGHIVLDGPPREVFIREDTLAGANLRLPEILELAKQFTGGKAVYFSGLTEFEQWLEGGSRP